jgi:tetratricopeptide (TPR) repeat protein
MIGEADLARYAGQFVWLDLNFDKPENGPFFAKYGAIGTPTFYIIDPQNGTVTATQPGAMSLTELTQFLDRGSAGVVHATQTSADAALTRGDALLAQEPEKAIDAYREALRSSPANWPRVELAKASLVEALGLANQWQQCAETAATEAADMKRDAMFGRTVMGGLSCTQSGSPAPWSRQAAARLEPLAKESLSLPSTVRDHRDELYRALMNLCLSRADNACAAQWGDRWLRELDTRKPTNDEERLAADIARVENIQTFGDPKRILPALIASEQAMRNNWNASLRVAQMESAANNYNRAIAACDRGLARTPGSVGRSWLLRVKADALKKQGQSDAARKALQEALQSAKAIPNPRTRDNNIRTINEALAQLSTK